MTTPRRFDTGILDKRVAADPASAGLLDALRGLGVHLGSAAARTSHPPRVDPPRAFVVTREREVVHRAKEDGFGFVVGIAVGGDQGRSAESLAPAGNKRALQESKRTLREAGADLVVPSIADLTVDDIDAWFANCAHARPSIPAHREALTRRLACRTPAVFLDYDGTLTPIVERPELAVLAPEMRRTLRDLAAQAPVIIVSGRGREDVSRLVGIEELIYAGSHGLDIAGPPASTGRAGDAAPGARQPHGSRSIRHEVAADLQPVMRRAAADLTVALASVPGVLVEDKRFAVTVHYRQVAADRVPEIEAAVDRVLAGQRSGGNPGAPGASPVLKKTRGKKVLELRPAVEWDKGKAVLWLLRALDLEGEEVVPIYLGDDTTDEDAFRALEHRGVTVLVSRTPRPTAAGYSLQDTDEVGDFLRFIASLGRSPGQAGMKLA